MKYLKLLIAILIISTTLSWKANSPFNYCKNSIYILNQAKKEYDANNKWKKLEMKVHIQEPRVGNPKRNTKIWFNNSSNYFEMEREREEGLIKRVITSNGESKIYLNGQSNVPENLKEKYGLNLERSKGFQNFYKVLNGIPMSITDDFWNKIEPAQKIEYEGKEAYGIRINLKDEMISKHWTLIISAESFKVLALEFNYPDTPDKEEEVIKFDGEYEVGGMKVPRIRHWYIKDTDEYLGTDIIVEEVK